MAKCLRPFGPGLHIYPKENVQLCDRAHLFSFPKNHNFSWWALATWIKFHLATGKIHNCLLQLPYNCLAFRYRFFSYKLDFPLDLGIGLREGQESQDVFPSWILAKLHKHISSVGILDVQQLRAGCFLLVQPHTITWGSQHWALHTSEQRGCNGRQWKFTNKKFTFITALMLG